MALKASSQLQQSASIPAKKHTPHPSGPRVLDRYKSQTVQNQFGEDAEVDANGDVSVADAVMAHK
ncbi:MAG TPA: hypothetical protein VHP58_06775 [Alphaproteobacteria bacterium]|nr:hypothetical protein [Alphaproteobacteria bacterium]